MADGAIRRRALALVATVLALALLLLAVNGRPSLALPGTTERVSVDSTGNEGNGDSVSPTISGDGRYVAFSSWASNLVPSDTNYSDDVFVHDRQTGATERVSVDSAGGQSNGDSGWPVISGDGRYVAFGSGASNLISGDTSGLWDVFVHDRQTGATERVSVDSAGNQASGTYPGSLGPAISRDGRYVAFESRATNLVPDDTNGTQDVFVHDRQTGITERVSVDNTGNQGDGWSQRSAISADGRYVAFMSMASNLVPDDTNGGDDIFVHDRQTGITERVSVDSSGNQGNDGSFSPAVSGDGRYVALESRASNLVPDDTNGGDDIFVHDRQTGITERVSVDSSGNQGNDGSFSPAVSGDGRYVAFESRASNLVPCDANGDGDVFVHDRQAGGTERLSVDSAGSQGDYQSLWPAISADGRYVAFMSGASNLVPGDANCWSDVFVRELPGIVEQGAINNCPRSGKWAISVWEGPDGTETGPALATCANGVAAAYYIEPDTQMWLGWFAGRPGISNLAALDDMQAVIALGGAEAAPTPTPCLPPTLRRCPPPSPTAAPPLTPTETPLAHAATNGLSDISAHARGGMLVADVAESAEVSDSSASGYLALAGLATVAAIPLTAGAWYARRRRAR